MASDRFHTSPAMADRRRAAGSSPVPRPPQRQTSEADFLVQAGVRTMMREAVLKLLEARPENPMAFLADYFGKLGPGPAGEAAADHGLPLPGQQRRARALWYLKLAHHSQRTAFNNNLSVAYDCLSAGGKKKKPGLNGKTHTDLLTKICQDGDLPKETLSALLKKIQCRDYEAVPFDVFRYGVVTCFVLIEFRSKVDTLFNILDEDSKSDQKVCQTVLDTLEEALVASDLSVPASYLEAGSKLGPDCLAVAMHRALLGKTGVAMSRSEFLKEACSLFLDKVKPIH
ncbi:tubulin polyglutamylase complex subunit 1 [Aquarana catesbeiana]|uniref:tubulin polyglutamylase complex subunit 1 n=1 Tax=Aquarana catesbeiana TaxID=8400 RepID=UPI003CC9F88B